MMAFPNVTRPRFIVLLVLACLSIAVVAIVVIASRRTTVRRDNSGGRLTYTGVTVSLPEQPTGTVATPDNRWLLVSVTSSSPNSNYPDGLAVLRRHSEAMSLVRIVQFIPGYDASGIVLSSNGNLAFVALHGSPSRIAVIDVRRATSGSGRALLGYITDRVEQGSFDVALSRDNRYAFSTDEDSAAVTVMKLPTGQTLTYAALDIIARVPVDPGPTGITLSPDGRLLYLVCQQSATSPAAGGVLTVLNVSKAEHDPAHALVARVITGPGSDPVRVVLDRSGTEAWVTDRSLNVVKVYSTRRMQSDPSHALLASARVGTAPVGIALIKQDTVAVVANSNRFSKTPRPETLTLLGTTAVLDRQSPLLGTLTVGAFPREFAQSADGQDLFVTNFGSNSVTAFDVSKLPGPR